MNHKNAIKSLSIGLTLAAMGFVSASSMAQDDMVKEMMIKCEGNMTEDVQVMKDKDGKEVKKVIKKCILKGEGGDMKGHKFIKKGDMSDEELKKMLEERGIDMSKMKGMKKMMIVEGDDHDKVHEQHMKDGTHEKHMKDGTHEKHEKMKKKMKVKKKGKKNIRAMMSGDNSCKGELEKEVTVTMDDEGNEVTTTTTKCTVKKK